MNRICAIAVILVLAALSCGGFYEKGAAASTNQKLVYTHDFITATKIVGRYYGSNVRNWLQSCSSSEGGHGGWVWRDHTRPVYYGSGKWEDKPGGWMQFFASTFYSNARSAYTNASRRGLRIRPKARSYYEPLGQAVVAAYIYVTNGSGQWTGSGC